MPLQPDPRETQALEKVWRSQAPAAGPVLDFTRAELIAPARPAAAEAVAQALRDWLQWPQ